MKTITGYGEGKRQQMLKSFGINDIRKAHLSESFSYNTKLNKTGAEVKEKLDAAEEISKQESAKYQVQYVSLLAELDKEPTEEPSEYLFRGTKNRHTEIPKVFEYEKMHPSVGINTVGPSIEGKKNKYEEYNEAARKFISSNTEIFLLSTLRASLEDGKEYEFNLEQLASLGF